ncbi:Nucleoporin NSP1 [Neolecta irregularis DAH-3]|uniref:Nucleoporin NSP1 n=1 Tax=Neolecta irregularis (strain DAH-3) TaxID=1198029 RepID=A0A1U7LQ20_NEOID|nr:Nucleoporin NSP1 [Neolecta irregularis DAH-3]|eukprot:OLL24770.1 Nucleoporin NSP1 [Neolecta irregularis DAH-3]
MSFNFNQNITASPSPFGSSATPAAGVSNPQQSNAPPLFGSNAPKPTSGGLFSGGGMTGTSAPGTGSGSFGSTTPLSTPSGNLFSGGNTANDSNPAAGGLFGNNTTPATFTGGGLFVNNPSSNSAVPLTSNLFGQTPAASSNLFGGNAKSATPSGILFPPAANVSGSTTPAGPAPAGGLFGSKPAESTAPGGLFGAKPADPSAATGLFGAKPAENKTSGFSFGSSTTTSGAKDDKPATSIPSFSFGSNSAATIAGKKDDTQTPAYSFGASSTEKVDKPAAAGGFSFLHTTTSAAPEKKDSIGNAATMNTPIPAAPAPPSLKNKSLDEIVTRWTNDLDKYSKEFQQLSNKVAKWDQDLVSNADKISNLYALTVQAEQSQGKIDQGLGYIESQQSELSSILDIYESQVSQIFENAEMNIGDSERESAYKLAENLDAQLISIEKNLTGVIEEMNVAGKEVKENDELAGLMKILNNQLASLRWIEEAEEKLRSKLVGRIDEP